MKSLHLWLSAALILGTCTEVPAFDLLSGDGATTPMESDASVLQSTRTPTSWFRSLIKPKAIFRAQSDEIVPTPTDTTETPANSVAVPDATSGTVTGPGLDLPDATTWNAFSPAITSDPFVNGGVVQPYAPGMAPVQAYPGPMAPPGGGFSTYGANGGRPYRFGWEQRLDLHLIPGADVSGGGTAGDYDEFGVDYDLAFTRPFMPGWILRETGLFRSRTYDGPSGGAGLPGSAFRLGLDFELATPQAGPYSISLGFTPSVNTDFNGGASSTAWQFDGRGIIWWQLNRGWMFGLGAMFWDRVEDRVVPYAGWVYRDDFWEWRIMLPESEIRLFIGNEPWWAKWIYFRARYNVEAYEISTITGARDEVEFEDWQLTLGFQMDAGYYRWFIEGGLVLDREIDFGANPDVNVDTAYITRIGWRY